MRAALAALALLPACKKAPSSEGLESRNGAVTARYEIHRNVDFNTFLQSQPPGSADALIMDAVPPAVFVVAKVSVTAPSGAGAGAPGFVSTFRFADGSSFKKPWRAASANPAGAYGAIFGFAKDVTQAETVLAP
jgi:hypothetical protein